MKTWALVLAGALVAASAPAHAEETCDLDLGELISTAVHIRSAEIGMARAPLQSPASSEVAASANSATDDPTPDASFPALIAMHLGVPTSTSDTGAITFNLTPFAIVAARNPDVIDDQTQYAKYEKMRKIGLALTLGGTGEAFDRDGDGVVDDALQAEDLSDIVSAELRYQFHGTRDRRDRDSRDKYFRGTDADFVRAAGALGVVSAKVATFVTSNIPPQSNSLWCMADAETLAATKAEVIDPSVPDIVHFLAVREDLLEEIDSSPIWTAVAGVTRRKDDFGPDLWWAGVRSAGGMGPDMGWSFTLDYGVTESLAGGDDAKRVKAGLEWAMLLAKRWVGKDGVRASLSGSYEKWQDVPGATDDTIGKLNFKLNFPLTDTINVPLSITWANKKALLQDESEMLGYIGFTFDFDGALRKALLPPQ